MLSLLKKLFNTKYLKYKMITRELFENVSLNEFFEDGTIEAVPVTTFNILKKKMCDRIF